MGKVVLFKFWKWERVKKFLIFILLGVRKWMGLVGWFLYVVSGVEENMYRIENLVFIRF